MKRIVLVVFLTLVPVLMAAPPAARAPYPWEKQGPAVPEFTIQPVRSHPCLLMDATDIPEIKRRIEALPRWSPAQLPRMNRQLHALMYGSEQDKKAATHEFLARFKEQLSLPNPSPRRCKELLYAYDVVASFGVLTVEEQRECQALAVRCAKLFVGDNPATFPSKETPRKDFGEFKEGFGAINRWTEQVVAAALVGLVFPGEPLAKEWVRYAVQQIDYQLLNGEWDGAWCEVPRYHDAEMFILGPFMQALLRRTGIDFFSSPHVKALANWYVRFSSPMVRFPETCKNNPSGEPTTPVWGASNFGPLFYNCGVFATYYAKSDPILSRRLMWMWRRAGCPQDWGGERGLILPMQLDPTLPDAPQILGSAFCRKFGYTLMRSCFDTPDETVVYMRGGSRGCSHFLWDLGTIDLFSHGIPLAVGSQSGPYQYPEGYWNSSPVSHNGVVFISPDKPSSTPEGGNPHVTEKGVQAAQAGTPLAFFSSPAVDYAAADCSRKAKLPEDAFTWARHLVLVKQPDYVVIWDQCTSPMASKWFLHTTGSRLDWKPGLIVSHTDYGADLDIHVLAPKGDLPRNEREGPFGGWTYDSKDRRKGDPYPFTMLKYITLSAPSGADYVTVLHPRKPDGPPVAATLLEQTKDRIVLNVNAGKTSDVITLTPQGGSFQRGNAAPVKLPMTLPDSVEPNGMLR